MQTVNAQSSLVIVSIKKEIPTFEERELMPQKEIQFLLTVRSVQKIISAKPEIGTSQMMLKARPPALTVVLPQPSNSQKLGLPQLPQLPSTEITALMMPSVSLPEISPPLVPMKSAKFPPVQEMPVTMTQRTAQLDISVMVITNVPLC